MTLTFTAALYGTWEFWSVTLGSKDGVHTSRTKHVSPTVACRTTALPLLRDQFMRSDFVCWGGAEATISLSVIRSSC